MHGSGFDAKNRADVEHYYSNIGDERDGNSTLLGAVFRHRLEEFHQIASLIDVADVWIGDADMAGIG